MIHSVRALSEKISEWFFASIVAFGKPVTGIWVTVDKDNRFA